MIANNLDRKGVATKRLLKDKESTIQLLKKMLGNPTTRLIQTSQLIEIEKEKESINTEIINSKARLLKHEEKDK